MYSTVNFRVDQGQNNKQKHSGLGTNSFTHTKKKRNERKDKPPLTSLTMKIPNENVGHTPALQLNEIQLNSIQFIYRNIE